MDQSLSITMVLEGGLPSFYLSVQDNYNSPAQIFNVPLELVDINLLVASAQTTGDYWMVVASPEMPRFTVESAIFVRHRDGHILWDLVYEHYEPFLNIELEEEPEEYEENIITFSFDPFQYVSAIYQACQFCHHLEPVTFNLPEDRSQIEHPSLHLGQHVPRLHMLWQKYGQTNDMIRNGQPTHESDFYAQEAEKQWLEEFLEALDEAHQENMTSNLSAYLDSLPEEALTDTEGNPTPLKEALLQRWETLMGSLTEEEAAALHNNQVAELFPNSLKLRILQECLQGNPSILLGQGHGTPPDDTDKVVDFQSWKRKRPTLAPPPATPDQPA